MLISLYKVSENFEAYHTGNLGGVKILIVLCVLFKIIYIVIQHHFQFL